MLMIMLVIQKKTIYDLDKIIENYNKYFQMLEKCYVTFNQRKIENS